MKYAVTAKDMKSYDIDTIERIGLSSQVLMERAALSVVEEINNTGRKFRKALIIAGCGNNGGDGIAMGRMLLLKGMQTDICLAGEKEKCTAQTRYQLQVLENLGFSTQRKITDAEYDLIVDALFGIGLSREVTGNERELIAYMNRKKAEGAYLCAVDIPSGISADTGKVLGCAVKADLTVSFAFAKMGHLLYPGKEYTGCLKIRDIGISEKSFGGRKPKAFYYEKEDIGNGLPVRKKDGNKGTFGKVLLIAGSEAMSGACLLCGKSIFRTGAGMVKIVTPSCNRDVLQHMLPEAMLYTWEGSFSEETLQGALNWADVIVVGPGIGIGREASRMMKCVLQYAQKPLVVDADGLNLIAEHGELKALAKAYGTDDRCPMVLTPHPGELVRISCTDMVTYETARLELLRKTAQEFRAVIAGKDAVTITVAPDQEEIAVNVSGNDGMATAGSGDVLAGVIGALLAQGMNAFEAAAIGVYLHGAAGDKMAEEKGHHGMMAGELADGVGDLLRELTAAKGT